MSAPLSDYRLPGDAALFYALNRGPAVLLGQLAADRTVQLLSSRAFGLGCAALLALAIGWRLRRQALGPVLIGALATVCTDRCGALVIKPALHRLRPCYALPARSFHQSLPAANVGSLPSLHAANAFAAATASVLAWPALGLVAFPLAVLVALSRVAGGVHWPSDVLVGALYGASMAWLSLAAWRRLPRRAGQEGSSS